MSEFEDMLKERESKTNIINKIKIKLMTNKYNRLKDKAMLENTEYKFKSEVYEINKEYINAKLTKKKLETSKLFMYFIIINCTVIELYSMYVMIHFADLSSLSSLMCAVITESISFAVYCAKAYLGKKGEVDAELRREDIDLERERIQLAKLGEEDHNEELICEDN